MTHPQALDPKGLEAVTRMLALLVTGKHVSELPFDRAELKEWHREGRITDINSETKESIAEAAAAIITTYLQERGDGWQPIERALRDKVYIMGWWDEGDFYQKVAWWDENLNKLGGGGWTDGTVASWGSEETAILYPTVCQELIPPPPTTDRGEGEGT